LLASGLSKQIAAPAVLAITSRDYEHQVTPQEMEALHADGARSGIAEECRSEDSQCQLVQKIRSKDGGFARSPFEPCHPLRSGINVSTTNALPEHRPLCYQQNPLAGRSPSNGRDHR
jgi:hypothetical protein